MMAYKPDDPKVIKEFFYMTHEDGWWILFKPQPVWLAEDKDTGLGKNPSVEEWLDLAKNIDEPAPLPEEPRSELLAAMSVSKPYKAHEPKKETREGLHSRGPPDAKSKDASVSSTREVEEAEQDEDMDSSQSKKRVPQEADKEALPPTA
ncbi:putative E3 ubiquitin-protein ligase ARI8 [Hordeum vulgare]|nr:putative E3 ubiquitin-protein ligase ARI8 [Hordeum vulgare]